MVDTPDELRLEVERLLSLEAEEDDRGGLTLSGNQRPVPRARATGTTTTITKTIVPPKDSSQ